jgi:hypothetical protein
MKSRLLAVLAACAFATGCANVERQPFNKEAAKHVNTVTVTKSQNDESYGVNILAHPGGSFGLIGALVIAADLSSKSNQLTAAVDPAKTGLQERMSSRLAEALQSAGYTSDVVLAPKGAQVKQVFEAVKPSLKSDALVAVDLSAQYIAAGPSSDYFPYVRAEVIQTDAKTGKVLYQDTITYGYAFERAQTVHLPSDVKFRFKDMADLVGNADRAREGFHAGVDAIIAQITSDLKK